MRKLRTDTLIKCSLSSRDGLGEEDVAPVFSFISNIKRRKSHGIGSDGSPLLSSATKRSTSERALEFTASLKAYNLSPNS